MWRPRAIPELPASVSTPRLFTRRLWRTARMPERQTSLRTRPRRKVARSRERPSMALNVALTLLAPPAEQLAQTAEALAQRRLEAAVGRLVEALAANGLRSERLIGDRLRFVVRVAVAVAAPQLPGARIVGILEIRRRLGGTVLANMGGGARDGAGGGIRLGRQRQIGGGLGEVERALRQPDPVDGLGRGVRDDQGLRVRIAHVLGGEDHHPAGDETGVLAALQHHRQVVDRGVDVRAAGGLDPGRDVVVVPVALPVVEERLPL